MTSYCNDNDYWIWLFSLSTHSTKTTNIKTIQWARPKSYDMIDDWWFLVESTNIIYDLIHNHMTWLMIIQEHMIVLWLHVVMIAFIVCEYMVYVCIQLKNWELQILYMDSSIYWWQCLMSYIDTRSNNTINAYWEPLT